MKRLSAIVIALCTMVHTVWAYDFSVVVSSGQTLYFNIDSNTVSVTYPSPYYYSPYNGYTKPTGNLVIPSSVTNNGTTYTVTTIGEYAFGYCYDLTSVTIPDSVTSIEEYAFEYCHNLTSVTIPNSVTSIGEWAFRSCTGLTSATIPNLITSIEEGSFYGCSGLTSITIPNLVTSIGSSAFYLCTGLTSVTIPNSVTSIGYEAFTYCSSLTSVTIPNSVTTIGNGAFADCSGLTSITIPDSITSIGERAFFYCTGLTSIIIPNLVTSIGKFAFAYCSGLTSVTIPNSVTSIGSDAFRNCSSLISVTIPNSVTYIGYDAFYSVKNIIYSGTATGSPWGAWNLNGYVDGDFIYSDSTKTTLTKYIGSATNVTIPNSVTSIGNYAFSECSDLTSVTISNSVTSIGNYAFSECSSLTSVTISNSVTSIGNYAFSECSGLTSITIPNSVTSIGEYAFSGCSGLTSITIPDSITSIGKYAFGYCTGLTSIIIPNLVTSIGEYAFAYCSGLTSVTIPNSVTSIGYRAFDGCSGLTSVTIPNSVTSIGSYAFSGCSGLTSVTISNSVTSIEGFTFYYCSGLTSVTIPNSVTSIGERAFEYCRGLTSVTIGNSVTSIGDYAFSHCTGLTSITIPDSITSIEEGAFSHCTGLTSIIIPNLVTSIGEYAFYYCSNLTSVTIPNSVTSIEEYAFYFCSNLTSVTIPNSVTSIGDYAFDYCNLTSVTIPNSVTSIGDYAFGNCGLNVIICKSTIPPTTSPTAWLGVPTNTNVYVPCGSSSVYSAYIAWSRFNNIQDTSYNIELSVNESLMGYAELLLNTCDSTIIEATPNRGYTFLNWSDGDTNNPRIITLTGDTTLIAYFEANNYTVTVTSANDSMGTVSGGGEYAFGSEVTITATAAEGYCFVSWSDGDTNNPRIITLTGDTTLIAYFEANNYTVTVISANDSMGTISGGGEYAFGSEVTITATAAEGYRFVSWNDGNTDNPRTITVTEDATYIANFADEDAQIYTITAMSANDSMGTVSGGGIYPEGTGVTLTATPVGNYLFVGWNDGNTENPRTITVTEDATYIANFAEEGAQTYTITVLSANNSMGAVTGSGTYPVGTVLTIAAIPTEGYRFVSWNDGNTDNPRTITVTEDATYIASFEEGVGIESRDILNELTFYPNPTSGIITFNRNDIIKVEVLDAMGRTVEVYENAYTIDISKLAKGYYAMRITTAEGVAVRKVIRK